MSELCCASSSPLEIVLSWNRVYITISIRYLGAVQKKLHLINGREGLEMDQLECFNHWLPPHYLGKMFCFEVLGANNSACAFHEPASVALDSILLNTPCGVFFPSVVWLYV